MHSNPFFPEIKGNFGFGCMRLPSKLGNIDYGVFESMVDKYLKCFLLLIYMKHSMTGIRDIIIILP